ncbi:hypothetical protein KPL70_009064 [Citrus sinensis]|uniref:TF-B3 domain-containing protein n=1 Tax=Citrus unshiu TaxID=55188 RepID=A0A2H5MZ74_CITUN|nr:hypothetical protein KPL70_009064 [Citrus sinensis]GAY32635.1 hypothetical protein CUMW_274050 [Citrus unshiu]
MGGTNEKLLFSKTLTKTDINNKFSVKCKSLASFPPSGAQKYFQDFNAEDEKGKKWLFRLRIRKGKHKKPVTSAGWRRFVRQKGLKIHDKVSFFTGHNEAEIATGVKYKIKVQKAVIVLKAVLGHAPCSG